MLSAKQFKEQINKKKCFKVNADWKFFYKRLPHFAAINSPERFFSKTVYMIFDLHSVTIFVKNTALSSLVCYDTFFFYNGLAFMPWGTSKLNMHYGYLDDELINTIPQEELWLCHLL